jgi:hypothetical protein
MCRLANNHACPDADISAGISAISNNQKQSARDYRAKKRLGI